MARVTYKVHELGKRDSNKRVVRIRSEAFRNFQGKNFIIRITSSRGKSACFKAEYVDATYRSNISGSDLVFLRKTWRDLLDIHPPENGKPPDQVELEEIPDNDSPYEVHSALSDDHNEGRVYIFNEQLHDKIKGKRCIVRITREDRKDIKPVYSEALYADDFYLEKWQDIWKKRGTEPNFCRLLFISEWYRLLLDIQIGDTSSLKVDLLDPKKREGLWPLLYLYPRDHPQAIVRTANMMGCLGVGLGIVGCGLGGLGIKDLLATNVAHFVVYGVSFAIALLGLGIALFGFIGLGIRRR